jgi:hypothetical protein
MDRLMRFERVEQQRAFFEKLAELVDSRRKAQKMGVVIPMKTQGCYLLVKRVKA